ncbi:MAG TPA: hypothetical protein VGL10_09560 [Gammaproteobacteria bacterium]
MTTNVSKSGSIQDSISRKTSDAAHRAVDRVSEKAETLESQMRSASKKAGEQTEVAIHQASQYLRQHPFTVLGIVFASGLLLSALLRK